MRSKRDIVIAAAIAILLMGVGYAFSPEGPGRGTELLDNRLFAAAIIGCGAGLAILYRRSIAALQRSETALREAHSLARLGHFVLRFGEADGLTCSEECLRISGRESEAGLTLRQTIRRVVHPEDRCRVLKEIRQDLARTGRYEVEFRIVRPDGDVRDVRSAGHTEGGHSGTRGRLIGTLLDVSEWRRSERALRESKARMRSVLDSAFDALILLNQQGEIESFSPSAESLFGFSSQEVRGQHVSVLLAPGRRGEAETLIRAVLATRDPRRIARRRKIQARRKDGSRLNVQIAISSIPLEQGWMFTVFIHDLTARQRLEEQLRQVQKMDAIGRVAGGIAHDFNNLLTVIMGNLEMLENRIRREPEKTLVREARETAEFGAQLTERLLAFGRRQPLDAEWVDLGQMLGNLLSLLRRSLGEQVDLQLHLEPDLPPVRLDPTQLQVALFNLALNARDAMPNGGRLDFSIRQIDAAKECRGEQGPKAGRYLMLSVRDTGTGMPEAVRLRSKEPFFTTKQPGKGTGLGLSVVDGFIMQSDGHMTIDSKEDEGTTVRLYLPCAQTGRKPKPRPPRPALQPPRAQGLRILVVEDDARVRRLTVSRLKTLGYQVAEAANGHAALEQLATHDDWALVFSDYVMPGGINGYELARKARALHPQIKVLLTTGYARPQQAGRGRLHGVRWLSKPYSMADLASALDGMFSSASTVRRRRARLDG